MQTVSTRRGGSYEVMFQPHFRGNNQSQLSEFSEEERNLHVSCNIKGSTRSKFTQISEIQAM